MLPLMLHKAVPSALPPTFRADSSMMTAASTPPLEPPVLLAAAVMELTPSSFSFSALISSCTIKPHLSRRYLKVVTGKLFVLKSALFSTPGVVPICKTPRFTKLLHPQHLATEMADFANALALADAPGSRRVQDQVRYDSEAKVHNDLADVHALARRGRR